MPSSRSRVLLVWWITCLIWSSIWLFIKIGVTDVPPLGFAAVRLTLASIVLVAFTLLRGVPWPTDRRDLSIIVGSGIILFGINYGILFWGAQFVPSGITAVLQASTPVFSLIIGGLFGSERLTTPKIAGVAVGIAGVAIVCLDQGRLSGSWSLAGSLAVTAGSVCVAISYAWVKAYKRPLESTTLMAGQMLAALAPLGIGALVVEGNPLAREWSGLAIVSLLYLAIAGSVIAMWLNYWLLRRMDATGVLAMGFVEPFIAVLLGAVFLDERLTARAAAGGVAVIASVWLILSRPPDPRAVTPGISEAPGRSAE